jgi:DNA polymerase III epsilon subunit-like protein
VGVSKELLLSYPCSLRQQTVFENILHKYVNSEDESKFQMAGFNVEFDYNFIKEWFNDTTNSRDFNTIFGYQRLDVLELVRHLKYLNLFRTQNNKLETLCEHFDIDINAHQVLSDIQATKILHQVLVEDFIK